MDKPINKQAALFLSRNKRCETVQEALEGACNAILRGDLSDKLALAFHGDFGPDPIVKFEICIRKDIKTPGEFTYKSNTKITHSLGEGCSFYGLKP